MAPKRDMDERVNSDADPIDLIRSFLEQPPISESEIEPAQDCGDELGIEPA